MMNVVKLDKSRFKSQHVLYIIKCDDLGGLYYIGKHTCTGRSYHCSQQACQYAGSSSVMSEYYALKPDARWVMSSLCFADDEKELKELELMHLSLHVSNPKCINKVIASSIRPPLTDVAKDNIRCANRLDKIKMLDSNDNLHLISISNLRAALSASYRLASNAVWLKNYAHNVQVQMGASNLHQVLSELLDKGWQIGTDRRLTKIKSSDFWQLVGYRLQRITTVRIVKL
jgi:hypothetical protein